MRKNAPGELRNYYRHKQLHQGMRSAFEVEASALPDRRRRRCSRQWSLWPMSDDLHRRTYDATLVAQSLAQLHEYVTSYNARIEITRAGSGERCVLLSKAELDALERAIEILSDTDDMRHVSEKLAHIAATVAEMDFAATA
jgi:PHD/YefM family antitoxin component YafN of YafNO toxin-antitoxin module